MARSLKCIIRQVNIADATVREQLLALHHEVFAADDWVGARVPAWKTGCWFIAFSGGEPLAFGGLMPSRRWEQTGVLCSSGVLPKYRGHGLQKSLIWRRIAKAQGLGWHTLITDTMNDNVASMNSLIACGFRPYTPLVKWSGSETAVYWRRPTTRRST